jgi:hypothetical protein
MANKRYLKNRNIRNSCINKKTSVRKKSPIEKKFQKPV